jgi:hypothetical protein
MRYLPLISMLFAVTGCTTLYSGLQKTAADPGCLQKFKPVFTSALYNAHIDVTDKHLSGLLVIKKMPDSSTRLVFSNEMGFTFFDFEFSKAGAFKIYRIVEQMNKKPVIRTLKKDFEIVLMQQQQGSAVYALQGEGLVYTAYPQAQGVYYYITDSLCRQLIKMQRASKKKVVMEAIASGYKNGTPDTIGISHKNFNFEIGLRKLAN